MKVILLKDLASYGKAGDIVSVSVGYARNYLIPNGIGKLATQANQHELKALHMIKQTENDDELVKLQAFKAQIESINLEFFLKTKAHHIFGAISHKHLLKDLKEKHGIVLNKHQLHHEGNLRTLGLTKVHIKLNHHVSAELSITIHPQEII